ncbi:hypothetical protein [Cupriavidus sp. TMH.W2]|uniref:hypothetical protein n=1 Tax=Cupriavidus sp. TMH.W2 TaxID=3434465 RepID=UPI003D77B43E
MLKNSQAEQHSPASAQPPTQTTSVEPDSRPAAARPSFTFNTRTPVAPSNAEGVQAGERTAAREHDDGSPPRTDLQQIEPEESGDGLEAIEAPPDFESDDLDPSEAVAASTSLRRAGCDARVVTRGNASPPGYKSSGGEGGDELCGIPGSAFIGYPADLPIGTAYSRAVWARASRQAGQNNAVVEIRTVHGGSAMVLAPRHQSADTHGSSSTPWVGIDRALLIEVRYRAHAEQGYRKVNVGIGGFHKELGTVDVDRPDLSALRRELGGATDQALYATVQISADRLSPEANGQVEREFWVVLPEESVRLLAARGKRQQTEPRHRSLGLWNNGILSRDSGGRPELRLADKNAGLLALPVAAAPDPEAGSAMDAKWTDAEGDFVLDTVERLLAGGMPTIQAEEAGIWALYEHRRVKLGLPESARLAFLVEPSGANEGSVVAPAAPTEPCETLLENTDPQSNADGEAVAAEPTKGARFGFGARPRA